MLLFDNVSEQRDENKKSMGREFYGPPIMTSGQVDMSVDFFGLFVYANIHFSDVGKHHMGDHNKNLE